MTAKQIILEIIENRLNLKNSFETFLHFEISKQTDEFCEEIFEDFLMFNLATSELRDFWRNKLD